MSIFLCERWRSTDLDISLAVRSQLDATAAVNIWIGTDTFATAEGMTTGVADAKLFVLVLRDKTLQGRGVQHEIAAALRMKKPVLVLFDEGSGLFDDILKQAKHPDGLPVVGYEMLTPSECDNLKGWLTSTAAPLAFRCDVSFEKSALPKIAETILSLLSIDESQRRSPHVDTTAIYRLRSLRPLGQAFPAVM